RTVAPSGAQSPCATTVALVCEALSFISPRRLPSPRGPAALLDERAVPDMHRGGVSIVTEHGKSSRIEQEVLSGARRQPDPAHAEHAQHVTMGEQRDVAAGPPHPGDHAVHPGSHLFRRLAVWAAIAKQLPVGASLVDLLGREALVVSVVPL